MKEKTMNTGSNPGSEQRVYPSGIIRLSEQEATRLAAIHDCLGHHTMIKPPGVVTESFMSSNPTQPHLVIIVAKDGSGGVSYTGAKIPGTVAEAEVLAFCGGFSEFVARFLNRTGSPTEIKLAAIDKDRN